MKEFCVEITQVSPLKVEFNDLETLTRRKDQLEMKCATLESEVRTLKIKIAEGEAFRAELKRQLAQALDERASDETREELKGLVEALRKDLILAHQDNQILANDLKLERLLATEFRSLIRSALTATKEI